MGSWGSYSINDVSAILPVMFGEGALDNYSKDPELEKLIAEGGTTSDKAVRAKAYSAAIKIATEKAYWLPINTYVNTYAFAKALDFKTYRRRAAALLSGEVEVTRKARHFHPERSEGSLQAGASGASQAL